MPPHAQTKAAAAITAPNHVVATRATTAAATTTSVDANSAPAPHPARYARKTATVTTSAPQNEGCRRRTADQSTPAKAADARARPSTQGSWPRL